MKNTFMNGMICGILASIAVVVVIGFVLAYA